MPRTIENNIQNNLSTVNNQHTFTFTKIGVHLHVNRHTYTVNKTVQRSLTILTPQKQQK